jgi:hypothetical protein
VRDGPLAFDLHAENHDAFLVARLNIHPFVVGDILGLLDNGGEAVLALDLYRVDGETQAGGRDQDSPQQAAAVFVGDAYPGGGAPRRSRRRR